MQEHPLSLDDPQPTRDALTALVEEVARRLDALPDCERRGYVGSELAAVDRALGRIQRDGLARGRLFCDWGSGLGGVCGVAALNGFSPCGIEIQHELVASARGLAEDLALPLSFAQGTFLLPGDEDLVAGSRHTGLAFDAGAWEELGLLPHDCDVVFAYPWPGEEACVDGIFERRASPGALLLTFHDRGRLLLQCKRSETGALEALGWM